MAKLAFAVFGLLLWTTAASANDGAERLNRFLEGLNTLQAEFFQTVITSRAYNKSGRSVRRNDISRLTTISNNAINHPPTPDLRP